MAHTQVHSGTTPKDVFYDGGYPTFTTVVNFGIQEVNVNDGGLLLASVRSRR